jgi:hypothetical protein
LLPEQKVSLALDFYRTRSFRKDIPFPLQHYASIETKWDWRIRDRWSMGVSYRYATQHYETTSQTAESHAVYWMTTFYGAAAGNGS